MNRLGIRLMLAMMLVAGVSFVVVPLAQRIASRATFSELPGALRQEVLRHTTPEGLFRPPPQADNGSARPAGPASAAATAGAPATDADNDSLLAEQNEQLLQLLGTFRANQQLAVAAGLTVALLLSVLLALALSRNLAVPFEALTRAASRIAVGDLSTRMALGHRKVQTREAQELTDDFNAMAASLETYEHERVAMMADIAHELRTPLATVQMRLEALQDGLVAWNDAEAALLQQHMRLLSRLVDDLRVLSLADAGRLSLQWQDLDLAGWLREVTPALCEEARRNGSELSVDMRGAEVRVRADADRLYQVLRNLVDNASEAMAGGGRVRIGLRREGEDAVLSVRDEGPGIDPDRLESIFGRFSHGDRRDTRGGAGRGLGLAIVRALVTLHGGSVAARNHERGAELAVRLPLLTRPSQG